MTITGQGKESAMVFDVLVCNGLVLDGTGRKGEMTDIGIEGDRIAEVGRIPPKHGKRVIDATGLAVSPGFIDLHSHADVVLASGENQIKFLEGRITQGITAEVSGNCGQGVAPVDANSKPTLERIG